MVLRVMLEERGPILDRKRPAVKIKLLLWYDFLDMRKIAATVVLSLAVGLSLAKEDAFVISAGKPSSQNTTANLTPAERVLVAASRQAIIATGMSEGYFDRHFALAKVVNLPGDRRIVWKFALNEYSTTVTDVLGYYTRNGQRIDTHSVTTTLGKSSNIAATISRSRANRIMQRCIGVFTNPNVEYRAASGGARLVFTAEAVRKSPREEKEREREIKQRARNAKPPPGDTIEAEAEGGAPIIVGTVDLQTGACTKGQLVVAP